MTDDLNTALIELAKVGAFTLDSDDQDNYEAMIDLYGKSRMIMSGYHKSPAEAIIALRQRMEEKALAGPFNEATQPTEEI